jgi:hypothetical protein
MKNAVVCLLFAGLVSYGHPSLAAPLPVDPAPAMRSVPKLAHIGIVVDDAAAAANATIRRFQLPPTALVTDVVNEVHGAVYKGKTVDFSAIFKIVDTGNTRIEYIQPLTGHSPYADAIAQGSAKVHHMAYVVPSIDEELANLRANGGPVDVILDAPIGHIGRYVYVDGVVPGLLVEFIQIGPLSAR